MLLWNWKLCLATGTGMGVTLGAYLLTQARWTLRWADWQRWFSSSQSPIVLAAGAGGVSTVVTYMATAIWASTDNHWMASGLILQGLATFGVLGLLGWQTLYRSTGRANVDLMAALTELSSDDPLKQRVALRQLEAWVKRGSVDDDERAAIADCCRLLLLRDTEKLVRESALALLQVLSLESEEAASEAFSLPEAMGPAINLRASRKVATRKREFSL